MANFRSLDAKQNELYQRVDEVLHYLWDPIGVSDVPAARDEYHSYLPHVFSLLKRGADEKEIAEYLGNVESQSMGLGTNRKHNLEVAEVLINWKDELLS